MGTHMEIPSRTIPSPPSTLNGRAVVLVVYPIPSPPVAFYYAYALSKKQPHVVDSVTVDSSFVDSNTAIKC